MTLHLTQGPDGRLTITGTANLSKHSGEIIKTVGGDTGTPVSRSVQNVRIEHTPRGNNGEEQRILLTNRIYDQTQTTIEAKSGLPAGSTRKAGDNNSYTNIPANRVTHRGQINIQRPNKGTGQPGSEIFKYQLASDGRSYSAPPPGHVLVQNYRTEFYGAVPTVQNAPQRTPEQHAALLRAAGYRA